MTSGAPILALGLAVGGLRPSQAADANAGTREFAFIEIMTPARTVGLAENQVALAEGTDAVGMNPAGLTRLEGESAVAATLRFLTLGEGGGQVAYVFGPVTSRLALAASYWNAGEIDLKEEDGSPLGVARPSAFSPSLSYARIVSENWRLGATLKGYQEYLGDFETSQSAVGWGVDVGALYSPGAKNLGFGLALVNAGRKFVAHTSDGRSGGNTPATLKAGLFYTPPRVRKLRVVVEAQGDDAENPKFGAGAEWSFSAYAVARAGLRGTWQELRHVWRVYGEGKDEALYGGEARRLGAGFTVLPLARTGLSIDYGVQWWTDLGFAHALTLKRGWGG